MNAKWLSWVSAVLALVGGSGAIEVSASSVKQAETYSSFTDWCVNRDSIDPAAAHTVEVLLERAQTKDCDRATAHLTRQRTLFLNNEEIVDVAPVASLTHLTQLYLHNNDISDISPLGAMTNLDRLYLGYNKISDLSGLSSLTNLWGLYLNFNQISDVRPLSSLTGLHELALSNNQIRNVNPLYALPNLERAFIHGNPIARQICPNNPDALCFIGN
ncbi:MAG: leucine-rich repeat domain-containing protein [Cyanobacteria bacterium SID2]|nr:leucine-rich repeat domain-containing protein [Cyanobacteria bacterium SID2]MBP0003358.1 leucine-rich repeat domain-containing protein [Cyanobacteria bacterium SBC]